MKKIYFVFAFGLLAMPLAQVHAGLNTLNGQTGTSQTFANDTNVTMSSSGNVHTLGWTGVLQPARGGTGTSTVMTQGSILFAGASGVYSQNNAPLNWDNTNSILGLGGNIKFSKNEGNDRTITVAASTTSGAQGTAMQIISGNAESTGSGSGGNILLQAGVGGADGFGTPGDGTGWTSGGHIFITSGIAGAVGAGGDITIKVGDAGSTSGSGGRMFLSAGNAPNGNGGSFYLNAGQGDGNGGGGILTMSGGNSDTHGGGDGSLAGGSGTEKGGTVDLTGGGSSEGSGGDVYIQPGSGALGSGHLQIADPDSNRVAIIDTSALSATDKTFTFQNASGTLPLLESNQIFTGLNKFQASSNTTVYIGSSSLSGCIAMGDDDGGGITYITAHRGVLSASTMKPSNCQ